MKESKPPQFNKENPKNKFLDNFISLRNEDEDAKKVLNFFQRIYDRVNILIEMEIITNSKIVESCKEFKKFIEKLKEEKFNQNRLADREDINEADKFLDAIIIELKK